MASTRRTAAATSRASIATLACRSRAVWCTRCGWPMTEESVTGTHVVLRLRTDDGIEGVSYVSRLGGGTIQPLALLIEAAVEQVVGADVFKGEAIYERLFRAGVGGPRSGLEARAASAVDAAVWDIKGKALGQPVYRSVWAVIAIGCRCRRTGACRRARPRTSSPPARAALLERGFRALKFQVGFLEREAALGHMRLMREIVGLRRQADRGRQSALDGQASHCHGPGAGGVRPVLDRGSGGGNRPRGPTAGARGARRVDLRGRGLSEHGAVSALARGGRRRRVHDRSRSRA